MFILLMQRRKLRRYVGSGKPLLTLIKYLATLMVCSFIAAVSYVITEKGNWSDAMLHAWQTTTTVGYGNSVPQTLSGRIATIFFGTASILLFAPTFTAYVDYYGDLKERKRRGMTANHHRNGVVVFYYPGSMNFSKFVGELRAKEPQLPICLVDNSLGGLPQVLNNQNIHYVSGSILDKETYEQANVQEARAVVVFPRNREDRESDAHTRFILKEVLKYIGANTRLMHMVVDPGNEHFYEGINSVPIYAGLSYLAAVQEIHDPGSALGVERLLLNTKGEDPHTVQIPPSLYGVTWEELQFAGIHAARELKANFGIHAVIRDGIPIYCPGLQYRLQEGDCLSLVLPLGVELDWQQVSTKIAAHR